jgi:hypothetical protein
MGATANSTGYKSFTATAVAIGEAVRVKLDSSGLISAASATEAWIGTTTAAVAASGLGSVKLRNAAGTFLVTASAAITAGALLYPTASGKVDDAAGTGVFTGLQAAEAATADGDIIEAVPCDCVAFTSSAAQAAVATTGSTNSSPYGFTTSAQADALVTLVNALRTACINAGIIKGS